MNPCRQTSGGPEPPRCDGVKVADTEGRLDAIASGHGGTRSVVVLD
jgi:hypothetical protein